MNKKKVMVLLTIFLVAVVLSACGSSTDQNNDDNNDVEAANEENNADVNSNKSGDDDADNNSETDGQNDSNNNEEASSNNSDQDENTTENANADESDTLSDYSSEEIEYARVWLQLGDTQDIDELNVEHISSGEPLNPDDETSVDYPEDVVQLTGSRLAEGSITYSGNGDGTVELYHNVPQRWDGENPAGEDTYEAIIEDTEQESIDPGDDEKVEELIKKLNVDS